MEGRSRRLGLWAWLSALAGVATTTVYLAVVSAQDTPVWAFVPWALLMVVPSVMALCAALAPNRAVRRFSAGAAATVFGVVGLLGTFTIGIGFLLAAGFALAATQERRETGHRELQHQP